MLTTFSSGANAQSGVREIVVTAFEKQVGHAVTHRLSLHRHWFDVSCGEITTQHLSTSRARQYRNFRGMKRCNQNHGEYMGLSKSIKLLCAIGSKQNAKQ